MLFIVYNTSHKGKELCPPLSFTTNKTNSTYTEILKTKNAVPKRNFDEVSTVRSRVWREEEFNNRDWRRGISRSTIWKKNHLPASSILTLITTTIFKSTMTQLLAVFMVVILDNKPICLTMTNLNFISIFWNLTKLTFSHDHPCHQTCVGHYPAKYKPHTLVDMWIGRWFYE